MRNTYFIFREKEETYGTTTSFYKQNAPGASFAHHYGAAFKRIDGYGGYHDGQFFLFYVAVNSLYSFYSDLALFTVCNDRCHGLYKNVDHKIYRVYLNKADVLQDSSPAEHIVEDLAKQGTVAAYGSLKEAEKL